MKDVFIGDTILKTNQKTVTGEYVQINSEKFYRIANYDLMQPFFMSIVSDSDHWMFLSSKGGLTAGRKNPENALFPYTTDDKIHDSSDITGSKSIIFVETGGKSYLWEPFSDNYKGSYNIQRNIYKNVTGNKIVFEEVNHELQITFQYGWFNSNKFGFVKKSKIQNNSNSQVQIHLLDGIQNILPAGVDRGMQTGFSTLVDAYKKNELLPENGIAIYSLSSIPVDRAEPSEALKATVVWSSGFDQVKKLLTSHQLDRFRFTQNVEQEVDTRALRGAYFLSASIDLKEQTDKQWYTVIDTNKDLADIVALQKLLKEEKNIAVEIENEIDKGTQNLIKTVANADGLQLTADELSSARHFSNVLFNVMRGGIFDNNYWVHKSDFVQFVRTANKSIASTYNDFLTGLPETIQYTELLALTSEKNNPDLERICYEYLPLTFSRRHGDPSRPWNLFSIETRNEDGSKILYYQGNWRDIFQNWEALALSFPVYIESMISRFLNASTADGYNPYRITRDGFDWEVHDPHDPWSNIGYWGDHQIIYLLKLLEVSDKFHPGKLNEFLEKNIFSYANVPYRIKSYMDLLQYPQDTIQFDAQAHELTKTRVKTIGSDGKLIWNQANTPYLVNLSEKMLVSVLSKFTNFIPEAGIWMNTQRPEWNDANNALVGSGVSMVTLYYMRRFQSFFAHLLEASKHEKLVLSQEVADMLAAIHNVLNENRHLLQQPLSDKNRKCLLDQLGYTGTGYRQKIYKHGFDGQKKGVKVSELIDFCKLSLEYIDHTIRANKRADQLYHAYNLMKLEGNDEVSIRHLYEMLEGQVAVLSSGYLSVDESLDVLKIMKASALFRIDQFSYLLYPNRQLPKFVEKNIIPAEEIQKSQLLKKLIEDGNKQIVLCDVDGNYHFNGSFRNANVLKVALENIRSKGYGNLVESDSVLICDLYERIFNHSAFTGRSGTFYKYEGLGCIYWHMVSKLLLVVKEIYFKAIESDAAKETISQLHDTYYEIKAGLGITKSPELYGSFPTDPYSHTPGHAGVQQPGMTGQVKEDIISRNGELGIHVDNGKIVFLPYLLRKEEFLTKPVTFAYYDVDGMLQSIDLEENTLVFTYCQIPVVYHLSNIEKITILQKDKSVKELEQLIIDEASSASIFNRKGDFIRLDIYLNLRKNGVTPIFLYY